MDWDEDIDARGLLCPLPVLKLQRRVRAVAPGRIVRLRATDPASWIDVPHYCRTSGHELLSADEAEGERIYRVRVRAPDG